MVQGGLVPHREPLTLLRGTREDIWSLGDSGCTHTVSSTSIAAAPVGRVQEKFYHLKLLEALRETFWLQAAASPD